MFVSGVEPLSTHWQQIQQAIKKDGDQLGNKSANLLALDKLCLKLAKELNVKVVVPSISPIPHSIIKKHLDTYAPTWMKAWEEFKKAQGQEMGELTAAAIVKLKEIQKLITEAFIHPLSKEVISILQSYLQGLQKQDPSQAMLMVRSTGREDAVDIANPGGNESVAAVKADQESIQKAIAVVVESYFSEKSLKPRLLSKQNILEDPFMPVLIQRMIGEPLQGEKDPNKVVRSGVMYTSPTGTRIQVAPGHGELVVNSRGFF